MPSTKRDRLRAHRILVCTRCSLGARAPRPGRQLIRALRAAPSNATDSTKAGLEELSRESDKAGVADLGVDCLGVDCLGVECLGGCERPCTVAYQCDGKAGYLFGDIDPRRDLDALIAFAAQYVQSGDGWTNAGQRPPALHDKTLARIPGGLTLSARAREGGR